MAQSAAVLAFILATQATIGEASQSEYFMVSTGLGWVAAEEACVAQGGHLASITSQAENDEVAQLCSTSVCNGTCYGGPTAYMCWIGGRKPAHDLSSGSFTWSDGTPVSFENPDHVVGGQFENAPEQPFLGMWNPHSTHNKNEPGRWQFEGGNIAYPAVCERPATVTPAPVTGCVCLGGTPAAGDLCPGDGVNLCMSCDDGWEKDTNQVAGTCFFPKDFCDDINVTVQPFGTCYEEIGHITGAGSVTFTKTWSATNTASWEACGSVSASKSVCASGEVSGGGQMGAPSVTAGAEACSSVDVTAQVCGGEAVERSRATTRDTTVDGVLGHTVFACLKGLHYNVDGRPFATYRSTSITFCARVGNWNGEGSGCPGTPCAVRLVGEHDDPTEEINGGPASKQVTATLLMVAAMVWGIPYA